MRSAQNITRKEMILKCENVKNELFDSIDNENRRINIDSAKKRAVMQHMDYDGFRQMVLGANIFPMKSAEFTEFTTQNTKRSGKLVTLY